MTEWNLEEALAYYRRQGAPSDQSALVQLLKEIQQERGGSLSLSDLQAVARDYVLKDSYLQAIIKRIPSLRLDQTHCLELCGGPSCAKRSSLEAFVRKTYGPDPKGFTVRSAGCMRLCGKGPNIRWDGVTYFGADEALIRSLIDSIR